MVPLVLGNPFLTMVRALINVQKGNTILKINDEQITFDVYKDFNFPSKDNTCFSIDAIDCFVDMSIQENKYVDPFDVNIGTEIKDIEIDKPLEGYSISSWMRPLEKKIRRNSLTF